MSEQAVPAEEIMDAVYDALCAHGYAALTMQDIADECSKSKSLLHYHYDTKAELLAAFLDDMIADYEDRTECACQASPVEQLVEFLARFVFGPDEDDRISFHLALLEMRSQGPFDEQIQARLDRSDELLRERVERILTDGIEAGLFEPVDTERTAALLVATLDGARTRQITLGETQPEAGYTRVVTEEILEQIVDPLLRPGVDRPALETVIESRDE